MRWNVVQVSAVTNHAFNVHFSDGTQGQVKFEPTFFRGVFAHLINQDEFKQVTVEDGAVTWPNDLDLAPDSLYEEIKAHGECVLS
ncbi:MAG: DUF2442 domain-containing protein [Aquirhabdus sp.]